MTNYKRWLFAALLLAAAPLALRADDTEAVELYREGRAAYDEQDYRAASKKFEEAELYARARIAALQMCRLPYQEFEAIERLLTGYPEYADFAALVRREYEIAKMYDDGVREPAFWSLRWIPWLVGDDKSIEIYRKALERAPFSENAPAARLRLAYLLDQEGQIKESLDELRRVIREFPDSPQCKWAYLALGNGLFELSRRGDGDARYAREAYDVFREFQNKYPDCIVAYRLGDFYEIFGENAVKTAEELNLTLTGRDCGLENRVPMIGFPYHASDNYFDKILQRGHKLAVAESSNDIRELSPTPKILPKSEKHWIDNKTYVDDDGVMHEIDDEQDEETAFDKSAFDMDALCKLDEIFGETLNLR